MALAANAESLARIDAFAKDFDLGTPVAKGRP
jgi:hypothetical protein